MLKELKRQRMKRHNGRKKPAVAQSRAEGATSNAELERDLAISERNDVIRCVPQNSARKW